MFLGQEIPIFKNWFLLHFTENYGMAFGLEFGGETGKLALSLFRIIAIIIFTYYLYKLIKQNGSKILIISISLILAGAIGNIIDSAFYGIIFNDSSSNHIAELFPKGGGYSSFLHGKVVDMLYFPLFEGYLPDWIPFWGGDFFVFFRPVFNIADASISIGVFMLFLSQTKIFKKNS